MTNSENDKISQTLEYFYKLCYPMVPHGIPTTVFHNAIEIITDLRAERDRQKEEIKKLSSLVMNK